MIDYSRLRFSKGTPRVVTQDAKDRIAKATERTCRRLIARRDQGQCRVCPRRSTHLHHLVPRSRGGKWITLNIVALCPRCHRYEHAAVLHLSGNPDHALYWEWLNAPLPGLVKPWGYSRPPTDKRGPGDRFRGRLP